MNGHRCGAFKGASLAANDGSAACPSIRRQRWVGGVLLLLIWSSTACAVEVHAQVGHVIDGDTIAIADGTRIRLLWVDTPESHTNSHGIAMPEGAAAAAFLRTTLPKNSDIRLWGPGDALSTDPYGRQLAVVLIGTSGNRSAQEAIIRAGWSPYWIKYGRAPEPYDAALRAAQESAQQDRSGAWTTAPAWIRDKANETTGKQR